MYLKSELPEGFVYRPGFLTEEEEAEVLGTIQGLEFASFQMRGVTARRRLVHFGWRYSFESYEITHAPPLPPALEPIRNRAAEVAGIKPVEFAEALVMEYTAGAGIGWHRDAPPFGIIAGISLASACRMRLQHGKGPERRTAAVELLPRSLYLLTGDARTKWEHMIPPTKSLRYSITFRTLRRAPDQLA
jgi:DNA oxidative demethylase